MHPLGRFLECANRFKPSELDHSAPARLVTSYLTDALYDSSSGNFVAKLGRPCAFAISAP